LAESLPRSIAISGAEDTSEIKYPRKNQDKPMDEDIILDFQHVTKTFPGVIALNDVSFRFAAERSTVYAVKMARENPL
jgi:hypothetical protein